VALLLAPVLAACSVNFNAPTDQVYTPGRGVNDRSGDVDVLAALIVSGRDGSGVVVATLVNNVLDEDDTLVDVSVNGTTANFTPAMQNVTIPGNGLVNLADEAGVTIEAPGVVAGMFADITFTFQRAQQITVHAPVVSNTGDYADIPMPSAASQGARR
jgi:hypothetical protein